MLLRISQDKKLIKLPGLDTTSNVTNYQNRNVWMATAVVLLTAVFAGIGLSAFGSLGQYVILGVLSLVLTLVIAFRSPLHFFFLFLVFMPINVYLLRFAELTLGPFNLVGGVKDVLLFVLVIAAVSTVQLKQRKFVVQDIVSILIVCYLIWAAFQAIRVQSFTGLVGFRIVAQFVLAYVALKVMVKDASQTRKLLWGVLLGGGFAIVIALAGMANITWFGLGSNVAGGRLTGVFPQVNMHGVYLGIVFTVGLLFLLENRVVRHQLFILVFDLGALVALIFTFSRRAWIGLLAGVMVWAFARLRLKDLSRFMLFAGILFVTFLFLDRYMFSEVSVYEVVEHRLALDSAEGLGGSAGAIHRANEVQRLLAVITQSTTNFLFGAGLGTYGTGRLTVEGSGTLHNSFLAIWVEMGLVGLSILLLVIAITLYRGVLTVRFDNDWVYIAGASLSGLVLILVSSFFGDMLGNYPFNFFFWFLVGIINIAYVDIRKVSNVKTR
jgi:putative inorganic carbon (hco3(-)) transporter